MFGLATSAVDLLKEVGGTVIKSIFPDKAKQQQELLKFETMIQQGEFKREESGMAIMLADAKSADKFTSRARPSFLYVMYIMILSGLAVAGLFVYDAHIAKEFIEGFKMWLAAIPPALYGLFGVCYTGYTAGRSYDKKKLLEVFQKLR